MNYVQTFGHGSFYACTCVICEQECSWLTDVAALQLFIFGSILGITRRPRKIVFYHLTVLVDAHVGLSEGSA